MQLIDYEITGPPGDRIIHFNSPTLTTLESLLNCDVKRGSIDSYLRDLYSLNNKWFDLDSMVKEKFNDYWDEEILRNFNVSGEWFTFGGSEDIIIYISKASKRLFIENEMLNNEPVVEMQLEEFIAILEQWKLIQATG